MLKNIVIALLLGVIVVLQVLQDEEGEPAAASDQSKGNDGPAVSNKSANGYDFSGKVYRVVDGDSLYIDGVEKQIRMWGVDAPERDERGYDDARLKLTALAKDEFVQCKRKDTDKYGRNVAQCFLRNGEDINKAMITSGLTNEYCRFTKNYYKTCRR